jgi:hypothetical protein
MEMELASQPAHMRAKYSLKIREYKESLKTQKKEMVSFFESIPTYGCLKWTLN